MPNVSVEDLERAVEQLVRSDKGKQAMCDLLAFLENGGISLDGNNQLHVLCLLSGAWGNCAGTALEALRGMVNPQTEPVAVEASAT